jgi:hypothetical protein
VSTQILFQKKRKKSILIDIIDVENGTKNLENLTYPVYIKPPCLMFSRFQYRIASQQELTDAVETVRPQLSNWNKTFHDFFRQYVDLDKYPLADKNIMLVEELVQNASHHCVEGWVEPDGSIHIWALSDQNYFTDGRMTLDNYSTPSYLSQDLQDRIISESIDIVKNIGIKSGFWNLEIWIQGDRYLLTEVNSRCVSFFYNLYSGAYQTSLYQAIIHLACGNVAACRALAPKAPENSGWVRFGAQFHVVTYGEGNVEDFIDYHFLDSISETKVTVFPDKGQYITQTSSAGYVLARFDLFGKSHEEINERALYLRSKMLKKPECSPDAIHMVGEKLAPSTRAASWVPGSQMDCAEP